MQEYQKYTIKAQQTFQASDYKHLNSNLQELKEMLPLNSTTYSTEMILTYVKSHSILTLSTIEHSSMAQLILSQSLPLQTMEALFEASRQNIVFQKDLEQYIRNRLNEGMAK